MIKFYKRFCLIFSYLSHVRSHIRKESYYPEEKRKSSFRILLDHLSLIIRYGEMPRFYFVYGLDRKSSNKNDYMPYAYFMALRREKNTIRVGTQTRYSYACLLRDKNLFAMISEKYNIPTPPIIGLLLSGEKETRHIEILKDHQKIPLKDYLSSLPNGASLFLKEQAGNKGNGAYELEKKDDQYYLNNKCQPLSQIISEFPTDATYIMQKKLVQHADMSKIYSYALNTLRIVSVVDGDDVVILGALLRIGANGSVVDNWAHGGIAVGVNENGTLMKYGLLKPGYGTKTDHHPDTGVIFEGYQIPFWKEIVDLVKESSRKLKCIPTIGWDIAVTEDGPIVIEGNDDYDGALLQACTGGKRKAFLKYYGKY